MALALWHYGTISPNSQVGHSELSGLVSRPAPGGLARHAPLCLAPAVGWCSLPCPAQPSHGQGLLLQQSRWLPGQVLVQGEAGAARLPWAAALPAPAKPAICGGNPSLPHQVIHQVTMEDAGRGEDLELHQLTGTIGNNNECEVGILYSVLQHCGYAVYHHGVPGPPGPGPGPAPPRGAGGPARHPGTQQSIACNGTVCHSCTRAGGI